MRTEKRHRDKGTAPTGPVLVVHPGSELYGSDRMLIESVRGLLAAHADVVVALPSDGPLVRELLVVGAHVWRVPSLVLRKALARPSGWPLLLTHALVGAIAASRTLARVRPCAVYVNTMTLPLWPVLARCARIPVVVHVHEAECEAPGLVRRLLVLPLHVTDHVLINSKFSRSVLAELLPEVAGRAELVPNGVVGPRCDPSSARRELRGPLRVLYLGRISRRKGVELAVDAVCRAAHDGLDVVLDLVGGVFPGYEQFETDLRRSVQERGMQDRIRFRGFQQDVWQWVDAGDVVVVPSLAPEPFGNTAVEAALGARPVIAADHSGLREAVAGFDAAQRVATSESAAPTEWAQALARVQAEWPQMRRAALADAELARQRHDPRLFGERVARAVLCRTWQGGGNA